MIEISTKTFGQEFGCERRSRPTDDLAISDADLTSSSTPIVAERLASTFSRHTAKPLDRLGGRIARTISPPGSELPPPTYTFARICDRCELFGEAGSDRGCKHGRSVIRTHNAKPRTVVLH